MARQERLRILAACEGESENGYAVFLKRFADECGLFIHIEAPVMKGGDALARLKWLEGYIEREEVRRTPFEHKFALLDTDQERLSPERAAQARRLAGQLGVIVLWQEPTHEGLLLRHFDGQTTRRPALAADALNQVRRVWPGYNKPMASQAYQKILNEDHVLRASLVEPQLKTLLIAIGILMPPK